MDVLSIVHMKITYMGIYWSVGTGTVMQEDYLDWFQCEDKTLGATLDPSELLSPPGSSLLWSIT